jgi:hypothetical protein
MNFSGAGGQAIGVRSRPEGTGRIEALGAGGPLTGMALDSWADDVDADRRPLADR